MTEEKAEKEVSVALERLAKYCEELKQAIKAIEDDLAPVLRPPTAPIEEKRNISASMGIPLADELEARVSHIVVQISTINALRRRLAI